MTEIDFLLKKINRGDNDVFKSLYGDDTLVLKKQADEYSRLVTNFETLYKWRQGWLFSSPGRTEIGGNHTDHNHGRVLAGSVSLDNIAVAAKNNSDLIRIDSAGYPSFEVDCSDTSPNDEEKFTAASLVKGMVAGIKKAGYRCGGFDASINGRVPKGSGLSSSASFEVLIGCIISNLFNDGKIDPVQIAIIGQFAENTYFGKPCGLMDQTACAVGGLITIDFREPSDPVVKKVDFDFTTTGYSLVITDTGGDHADLNEEYASLPAEMKSVAAALGASVLREVTLEEIIEEIPVLRSNAGDRAILRAYHFQGDNDRVVRQVQALERGDFKSFLGMVVESGYSSFMYNQNIHSPHSVTEQGVALGLAMSEMVLKGEGAWRVHGGGFAGTIQAFVPDALLTKYIRTMEHIFGKGACHNLFIRNRGAFRLPL
jgi:galactokinase